MSGPHDLSPSRRTRVLIGVATFWPPLYFVLFLAFIGFMFFTAAQHRSMRIPAALTIIFPLHCLTIVLCFVLTGVYIVHAATSDRHSQEMRVIWIISLFMGKHVRSRCTGGCTCGPETRVHAVRLNMFKKTP